MTARGGGSAGPRRRTFGCCGKFKVAVVVVRRDAENATKNTPRSRTVISAVGVYARNDRRLKQTECHPMTATKILLSSLGTYYYYCNPDEHRGKPINGDRVSEKQWYHDIIACNKCLQHRPKNDRKKYIPIMWIPLENVIIVNYQNYLYYRSKR